MKKRLCILTVEGNPIAAELFQVLLKEYEVFMLYTTNANLSIRQIWSNKRGGRWFWYNKLFNAAAKLYGVGHNPDPGWKELQCRHPKAFIFTDKHNSTLNKDKLTALDLDLGILIGTPIIKPDVFELPKLGMINLHLGNIPRYRGVPPAFWEHYYKEKKMSATVHVVVKSLDAGAILEEVSFDISRYPHYVVSKFHANTLSTAMLEKAIYKRVNGSTGVVRKVDKIINTVPEYMTLLSETLRFLKIFFYKKFSGRCV